MSDMSDTTRGGFLQPSESQASNDTDRPEFVTRLVNRQWCVEDELRPSSPRELERMMEDNAKELRRKKEEGEL